MIDVQGTRLFRGVGELCFICWQCCSWGGTIAIVVCLVSKVRVDGRRKGSCGYGEYVGGEKRIGFSNAALEVQLFSFTRLWTNRKRCCAKRTVRCAT